MEELNGQEIERIGTHYENLMVYTKEGAYFVDLDSLKEFLSKQTFNVEKKRTRNWIKIKK